MSTPYNYANVGNTDSGPRSGGHYSGPVDAALAYVSFITNDGHGTRYQPFLDAAAANASIPDLAHLIAQEGWASDISYADGLIATWQQYPEG